MRAKAFLNAAHLTTTYLPDEVLNMISQTSPHTRNNNELWETVFYKDGNAMSEFAPFPREGSHKPTLCVWEMAPVWHEQQAWVRFLNSPRDEAAAQLWLRDQYSGDA